METIRHFLEDVSGAQLVEYALLITFIALFVIIALQGLGASVLGPFTRAQAELGGG